MEVGEWTVRVLGPVQLVGAGGDVVDLPSASQRRLLAGLAVHAPSPVRAEWLCGMLDVTPGALRTLVTRLRRVVGDGLLQTSVTGYRLKAPVDATLACAEIQSANGDPTTLARALSRWVGRALDEFAEEPWAVGTAVRLGAVRAAAVEDLAEALIAAHRTDEAIAVLEPHVIEYPYRDRPRGLNIRALAASGRRTEALRAYQCYRKFLAESAGTEPSAELRRIEQRVAAGWDGIDGDRAVADHSDSGATSRPYSTPVVLQEPLAAAPVSVGREREFRLLIDASDRALGGGAQTVLLSGEAGIGKTTLIAAFARGYCTSAGLNVFYGRCDEHVVVPFQPFQSLIGRIVDELPDDVLMAHTATSGGYLLRLLPQLRTRVSATAPLAGDEITVRHLLFEAVVDVVRRAAAIAPLVLVLDDLHWAEPTALLLLRHLVRKLFASPVVFLAAFRDTADAADGHLRTTLGDLARSDAVRIELEGFDTTELGHLVQARVAATAGHDVGSLADRLRFETGGNPLFAEHLLRHWVGSGQLDLDDRVVTLSGQAAVDVPSTLRDLVWHRVSVLGPDAGPVLTAAAVLGVQFDEQVLAAMANVEGRDVAQLLDGAVAAGVLADEPSASGTVRFAHALVARSMEAELGSRARMRLHADAFRATLATHATPSAELAPSLAHHAELGGLLQEAQRWASEAGDQAFANLAPDEAATWFSKALEHATALGRPDAERADLLVRLGEAGYRAGHPTSLDTIRQGAELAEACGADATTLVRAALATDRGLTRLGSFAAEQLAIVEAALRRVDHANLTTRARILALLAQSLVHTDQTERRTAAALEALDLARSSSDPTLLARVATDVLYALWAPGNGSIRSALAAEATAIAYETGDAHLTYVVHVAAYSSAVCTGDAERAAQYLDRLRLVVDEIGEPRMRWGVGILDGFAATMAARFDEAERIIAGSVELGVQIGEPDAFSFFAGQSFVLGTFAGRHAELFPIVQQVIEADASVGLQFRIGHAIICCEVGQPEVAFSLLREAMAQGLGAIPNDLMRSTTLVGYAILALELGDLVAAAWLYPEIVPLAGEVSFNGLTSQGPVSAYAGKLASFLGMYGDAERFFLDALALSESFGWEYHRATTLLALAVNRFRANGALDEEGERWLATAEQLCATHHIDGWARRAAALRAQIAT